MVKYLYIVALAAFWSLQATADVTFHNSKSPEWEAQVLQLFADVDTILPEDWPTPDNYHVVYSPGALPVYFPVYRQKTRQAMETYQKVLFIGDVGPATMVHEYGHLVFDELLRERAPAWSYNLAWMQIGRADIEENIVDYKKRIAMVTEVYLEFKAKQDNGTLKDHELTVLENSSRTIVDHSTLVKELEAAHKLDQETEYFLGAINAVEALEGKLELFSDVLAVLYNDDWSVVYEEALQDTTLEDVEAFMRPSEDKEKAFQDYVSHRDFIKGLSLDDYNFEPWMEKAPYNRYAPTRSLIREISEDEGVSDKTLLLALGKSIVDIFNNEIAPHPENTQRSLFTKNLRLQTHLNENLGQ